MLGDHHLVSGRHRGAQAPPDNVPERSKGLCSGRSIFVCASSNLAVVTFCRTGARPAPPYRGRPRGRPEAGRGGPAPVEAGTAAGPPGPSLRGSVRSGPYAAPEGPLPPAPGSPRETPRGAPRGPAFLSRGVVVTPRGTVPAWGARRGRPHVSGGDEEAQGDEDETQHDPPGIRREEDPLRGRSPRAPRPPRAPGSPRPPRAPRRALREKRPRRGRMERMRRTPRPGRSCRGGAMAIVGGRRAPQRWSAEPQARAE